MDEVLDKKIQNAIWVAKSLYDRGKTAGSSANLSFFYNDVIYITGSGTCFGKLEKEDFSIVNINGEHIGGIKPSKEFPLHRIFYKKDSTIKAVIHTHSFYSTLWSSLNHEDKEDIIPEYTPYLKMKVGSIALIPYAKPGSDQLFKYFEENINRGDGFLLKNHGNIVGDKDIMSAYFALEELEESAKIAWYLRSEKVPTIS